jgi:hypothetical protein
MATGLGGSGMNGLGLIGCTNEPGGKECDSFLAQQ